MANSYWQSYMQATGNSTSGDDIELSWWTESPWTRIWDNHIMPIRNPIGSHKQIKSSLDAQSKPLDGGYILLYRWYADFIQFIFVVPQSKHFLFAMDDGEDFQRTFHQTPYQQLNGAEKWKGLTFSGCWRYWTLTVHRTASKLVLCSSRVCSRFRSFTKK